MPLGYLIGYLLAASMMLADVAQAAPAAAREMHADSGAATAFNQAASHERECVGPKRCVARPDAVAPAYSFQPGAMAPAGRFAPPRAILALPSRGEPRAAHPFSILFRNFRS